MAGFLTLDQPLPRLAINEQAGIACPFPAVQIYTEVAARVWWSQMGPVAQSQTPPVLIAAGSQVVVYRPLWAKSLIVEAQAAGYIQVAPMVSVFVDAQDIAPLLQSRVC